MVAQDTGKCTQLSCHGVTAWLILLFFCQANKFIHSTIVWWLVEDDCSLPLMSCGVYLPVSRDIWTCVRRMTRARPVLWTAVHNCQDSTMRRMCDMRVHAGLSSASCAVRSSPATPSRSAPCWSIHRVKRRHSNLWSRYDPRVVGHDVIVCEINWWRFVTLFKQDGT